MVPGLFVLSHRAGAVPFFSAGDKKDPAWQQAGSGGTIRQGKRLARLLQVTIELGLGGEDQAAIAADRLAVRFEGADEA